MKLALPHVQVPVFFSDRDTFSEGFKESRNSPRKRIAKPIHRRLDDGVQRLINFLQPGTYIPPHFHPAEGFSESIQVLTGAICFFEFGIRGEVLHRQVLRAGTPQCLVDLVGDVVHSFVCLEEDTSVLEIKKGPYLAEGDKCFMEWAPRENDAVAVEYRLGLEKSVNWG